MNLKSRFLCLLFACSGIVQLSSAQTPTDGLMMPKGEICVAVVYEDAQWDHYWEGTYLRTNGNIGTFDRKMLMPMIVGGITDDINVIVSLPYVKTSASGGQIAGIDGLNTGGGGGGVRLSATAMPKVRPKTTASVIASLSSGPRACGSDRNAATPLRRCRQPMKPSAHSATALATTNGP